MKALLFFAIFTTTSLYGQTNIIAAKSHASSQVIDHHDTDNFGDPGPMRFIEKVEYLKADCIVEKYRVEWSNHDTEYDTICDHPFLKEGQIDVDRIKAMYPDGTKFIGFEKLNQDQGNATIKVKKDKHSKKSSAFWILIISGGFFLLYLFIPKMSLKTS